jgi:hypothetical protein
MTFSPPLLSLEERVRGRGNIYMQHIERLTILPVPSIHERPLFQFLFYKSIYHGIGSASAGDQERAITDLNKITEWWFG